MNYDIGIELLCVIMVLTGIYFYLSANFTYWRIRNVKGPQPLPILGTFKDVSVRKVLMRDYLRKLYAKYSKHRLVGLFSGSTPVLMIADVEFAKHVLVKDFTVFADRGIIVNDEVDTFGSSLFSLPAEKWRVLRNKLSPVFSSSKLKDMFYLFNECGEHLGKYLNREIKKENNIIDCRKISNTFTVNVIGSCAFGLDLNTLEDENCDFLKYSRRVFEPKLKTIIGEIMKGKLPGLYNKIGMYFVDKEVREYFMNIVTETLKYRKEHNVIRHDFVDVLLDLKEHPEKVPELNLTDKFLTSQAVIFFIAGFHSSSVTVSHTLYELARNIDIQDKLRDEIKNIHGKANGTLEYEQINDTPYLDAVIKETLRKYSPVVYLFRKTTKAYRFTDTSIVIPKGQSIWIPIDAFHYDSNIYPRPEVFDPQRFMNIESQSTKPMFYLPFGDGPRNCIGGRFAQYQMKVALIKILLNYKLETCEKTKLAHVCKYRNSIVYPKGPIYLKMTKISSQ